MRRGTTGTEHRRRLGVRQVVGGVVYSFVIIAFHGWATIAPRADDTKQVLILHSNQSVLPSTNLVDSGIRQEMQSQLPGRLELFSEFLDTEHFPGPERDERMALFLKDKYAKQPIDLLITIGPQALNLLLQRRAWLFPNTPIFFTVIREENELLRSLPPGVTGLTSHFDPVPTVELALHLQPNARQLVVVTGTTEADRDAEEIARRALRDYKDKLQVRYLAGLPMAELLRELGQLPPDTIVLYLAITRDGTGQNFIPRNVAQELSKSATAPVYGVYDTYLGRGVVGGYMDTFEAVGRQAGRLGLRLLAGERPETISPSPASTGAIYVDWRQLQRWGPRRVTAAARQHRAVQATVALGSL
jgi:ABC-type uncharacterized transport system substrate-binding protein